MQRSETIMQLGMIGLGGVGANLVRRLIRSGHSCVVLDRSLRRVEQVSSEKGATAAKSLDEFVSMQKTPRTIWLMAPAAAVNDTLRQLVPLLQRGDVVIDG